MEKGQLEALPGQAYITGVIRVHARHLGLDSDELLGRLNALQDGVRLNCQIPILLTKP
jgi:cytoskeletal protein RodZ